MGRRRSREHAARLYRYEKIECYVQGVRDYIKFLKRGYHRVTQMTALDLRNGRIEKAEAERLVREYENKRPPSLDIFLEYLDITEEEFNGIVLKTVVPPHQPDFDAITPAGRHGISTSGIERNEIGARWNRESRDGKSPLRVECSRFVRLRSLHRRGAGAARLAQHLILPASGRFIPQCVGSTKRRCSSRSMIL